jgi:hypothetical protein
MQRRPTLDVDEIDSGPRLKKDSDGLGVAELARTKERGLQRSIKSVDGSAARGKNTDTTLAARVCCSMEGRTTAAVNGMDVEASLHKEHEPLSSACKFVSVCVSESVDMGLGDTRTPWSLYARLLLQPT